MRATVAAGGAVGVRLLYGRGKGFETTFGAVDLPHGRWFALAVVHSVARSVLGTPELQVFVDAELRGAVACKIPSFRGLCTAGRVGGGGLRAQVASVLVASPLSAAAVAAQRAMGPTGHDVSELAPAPALLCHAHGVEAGGALPNHAPARGPGDAPGRVHCRMLLQSSALHRLILEVGFALPTLWLGLLRDGADGFQHQITALAVEAASAAVEAARGSLGFPEQAITAGIRGFAGVLRELPHVALEPESLSRIASLVETLDPDTPLREAMEECLAFNFRVWRRSGGEIAQMHCQLVLMALHKRPGHLRERLGLPFLLDGLAAFPAEGGSDKACRALLLEAMSLFVGIECTPADGRVLLDFVVAATPLPAAADVAWSIERAVRVYHNGGDDEPRGDGGPSAEVGQALERVLASESPPLELYAAALRPSAALREASLWLISHLCNAAHTLGEGGRAALRLQDTGFAAMVSAWSEGPVTRGMLEALVSIGSIPAAAAAEPLLRPVLDPAADPDEVPFTLVDTSVPSPDFITSHPHFLGSEDPRPASPGEDQDPRGRSVVTRALMTAASGAARTVKGAAAGVVGAVSAVGTGAMHTTARIIMSPGAGKSRRSRHADAALRSRQVGTVETAASLERFSGPRRIVAPSALLAVCRLRETAPRGGSSPWAHSIRLISRAIAGAENPERLAAVPSWERDVLATLHELSSADADAPRGGESGAYTCTGADLSARHPPEVAVLLHVLATVVVGCDDAEAVECAWAAISAELGAIHFEGRAPGVPLARELKMWFAALALERLGLQLEEATPRGVLGPTASALLLAAENVLYLEDADAGWLFRTVLSVAIVRYCRAAGVEFNATFDFTPAAPPQHLARLSSGGSGTGLGGGNPHVHRGGGVLRLTLRVAVVELLFVGCDTAVPAGARAVCANAAVAWLKRLRMAPEAETALSTERAMFVIWNLHRALTAALASPEEQETAVLLGTVLRQFVKWWWWCLTPDGDAANDGYAPIEDPGDPRLRPAPSAALESAAAMLRSAWWSGVVAASVRPKAAAHATAEHFDAGDYAPMLRSRLGSYYDDMQAPRDAARGAFDASARTVQQGAIEGPAAAAVERDAARALQAGSRDRRLVGAGRTALKECEWVLNGPAGLLVQMGLVSVDGGPGAWRMSDAEDFGRTRRLLLPLWPFDRHEDASQLRDHPSGAPTDAAPSAEFQVDVRAEGETAVVVADGDEEEEEEGAAEDGDVELERDESPGALGAGAEGDGADSVVHTCRAELVQHMWTVPGRLEITTTWLYFVPDVGFVPEVKLPTPLQESAHLEVRLSEVRAVHPRRFNLEPRALEVLLVQRTAAHMLAFSDEDQRVAVFEAIVAQHTPRLV